MSKATNAKRVHIALAVDDLEDAIAEFTERLGVPPRAIAGGEYALFLTPILNLSISEVAGQAGKLRHLGFEDDTAPSFTIETDSNGFIWEHFTLGQQAEEINAYWPKTGWNPGPEE
ncbi:hypothetical protein GQF03_18555 [Sneathiella chungangensis]|uniref:VOC domain-containing protein n=1 Tax=Sneathiella chungangensis TaxID=1418234 RepID=A0A845MKV5_9PROT|nr:hypothetical protein [Sneathiella chungangensis]MZR24341.1 hypothetical protein [Sneathiella chungangensis]